MSAMSRTRQRECLAQRGKRRKGRQKSVVRNYVAEVGNYWRRWAFAKLDATRRKEYWSKIVKAYKSMIVREGFGATRDEGGRHARGAAGGHDGEGVRAQARL